jgi:peptidyl-prolyl cis-trans isomerase A (cyclophilin A)
MHVPRTLVFVFAGFLVVASIFTARTHETFKVAFTVNNLADSSRGVFTVEVHPEWAPLGADRFKTLVQQGFYDKARFFRVIAHFMAQFGISGDPKVSASWHGKDILDDPVQVRNSRGRLTFATSGPNMRGTQIFVNFKDNHFLDSQGFAPFAEVVDGMDVVDKLYNGYGEGHPEGNGPAQDRLEAEGNAYLNSNYPKLSYIESAAIIATLGQAVGSEAQSFYTAHRAFVLSCEVALGILASVAAMRYAVHLRKKPRETL